MLDLPDPFGIPEEIFSKMVIVAQWKAAQRKIAIEKLHARDEERRKERELEDEKTNIREYYIWLREENSKRFNAVCGPRPRSGARTRLYPGIGHSLVRAFMEDWNLDVDDEDVVMAAIECRIQYREQKPPRRKVIRNEPPWWFTVHAESL